MSKFWAVCHLLCAISCAMAASKEHEVQIIGQWFIWFMAVMAILNFFIFIVETQRDDN